MKTWKLKILSLILLPGFTLAQAHRVGTQSFEEIQIQERLGNKLPVQELEFKDENGQPVKLSDYFDGQKPVLVSLIYFGCPSICGFLLNGVTAAMRRLDWSIGKEYRVLVVSIDPKEGPDLALAKKETYLDQYKRPEAAQDWHFLTGTEDQIRRLADELGYGFKYIEETGEYAHSAGIFILTPQAVVSRVLYGIEFSPQDLKLALLEASNGKIGNVVDRFMMFCFRYDPDSKSYALHALRLVQASAGLFLLIFGGYLFLYWRSERKKTKA